MSTSKDDPDIGIAELEKERLRQELTEGYQARSQEDIEMNAEWEPATLESWE